MQLFPELLVIQTLNYDTSAHSSRASLPEPLWAFTSAFLYVTSPSSVSGATVRKSSVSVRAFGLSSTAIFSPKGSLSAFHASSSFPSVGKTGRTGPLRHTAQMSLSYSTNEAVIQYLLERHTAPMAKPPLAPCLTDDWMTAETTQPDHITAWSSSQAKDTVTFSQSFTRKSRQTQYHTLNNHKYIPLGRIREILFI